MQHNCKRPALWVNHKWFITLQQEVPFISPVEPKLTPFAASLQVHNLPFSFACHVYAELEHSQEGDNFNCCLISNQTTRIMLFIVWNRAFLLVWDWCQLLTSQKWDVETKGYFIEKCHLSSHHTEGGRHPSTALTALKVPARPYITVTFSSLQRESTHRLHVNVFFFFCRARIDLP